MLHRLSLRVLPQLNTLVTDPAVRKRKRLVMLAPGLVAFLIYRLLKSVLPLSDPLVLLALSGSVSALSAIWAFRQGRGISLSESLRKDGIRLWAWLVGWTGFVYGVQLALLVLAILQVFVGYDFLLHPEGPAMMAMIIPCTSATRDAFEIGHVQKVKHEGVLVPTFPDGQAFRQWISEKLRVFVLWAGGASLLAVIASFVIFNVGPLAWQPFLQSLVIPAIVATAGIVIFSQGQTLSLQDGGAAKRSFNWVSTLGFWIWPNMTFAVTYFLVMIGVASYVLRWESITQTGFVCMAAMTGMLMGGYTLFLGARKVLEERMVGIPENIQRCPFVMGLLQGTKSSQSVPSLTDMNMSHGDVVK